MPIRVYQKRNTFLPALEAFAKYLAPIAEQKQLADLSQGQNELYKGIKDPQKLIEIHAKYINKINSDSSISAQNKQQLLQNANLFAGFKEKQLTEAKRLFDEKATFNMVNEITSGNEFDVNGSMKKGQEIAALALQKAGGDYGLAAKYLQAFTKDEVQTKYDVGFDPTTKGYIGTQAKVGRGGKVFASDNGVIKQYKMGPNGEIGYYFDKNKNQEFTPGEELTPEMLKDYSHQTKLDTQRAEDKAIQAQNHADLVAARNVQHGPIALKSGDTIDGTIIWKGTKATYFDSNGNEIANNLVDHKGIAKSTINKDATYGTDEQYNKMQEDYNKILTTRKVRLIGMIKNKLSAADQKNLEYGNLVDIEATYDKIKSDNTLADIIKEEEEKPYNSQNHDLINAYADIYAIRRIKIEKENLRSDAVAKVLFGKPKVTWETD